MTRRIFLGAAIAAMTGRRLVGKALELAIKLDPAVILQRAGYPPDPWQAKVLRERPEETLFNWSRQGGKSQTVAAMAVDQALTDESLILILSRAERQSKETLLKVKTLCRRLQMSPLRFKADSSLTLEFINGSRVIALPDQEGNVRGYSDVKLLIIDEASRVSDDLYDAVRPMRAVSHGRIVALSTPYGKRGWWYKAWVEEPEWEKIQVTAAECPRITREFLEAERTKVPYAFFRQEYFCEFLDTTDHAFKYDDVKAAFSDDVLPLFAPTETPMSAEVGRLFQ